jgi:tripartite ATP-independent transporter DctM subunit
MFLGGILPGILLVIAASTWGIWQSPKDKSALATFNWAEARSALWDAKWELLLPAVAIAALFSGYATAVQASAITALYAFIVETLVYRDLKITKDLPRVMTECGLLVGAILMILGVALGFTGYLIDAQVPAFLIAWVKGAVQSPWVFLLALNFFLLIVGCLMDIFSAIVVVVPIMLPIGAAFGIDPVHLGIIFLANLELGYLTPPVGMNLYLSSYRFNKPMPEVVRSIIPILLVLLGGVLLITYVPFLSTALPGWFK